MPAAPPWQKVLRPRRPPATRGGIRRPAAGPDRAGGRARWPDRAAWRRAGCRARPPHRSRVEPIGTGPGARARLVGDQLVVGGRDGVDLVERERAPGGRDQSQGLAAGRGTARQSRQDEPREAAPNDALGSSRRAASSSSTTSGLPADRSATRSSTDAEARSPSMADQLGDLAPGQRPEDDALRRPRPLGERGEVRRRSGWSRVRRSGW